MKTTADILTAYLQALAAQAATEATIKIYRAELLARGKEIIAREGAAPTLKVKGLGSYRIDGVGAAPTATIVDPQQVATYAAGLTTDAGDTPLAEAVIRIHPAKVADAIAALRDFADVDPRITHELTTAGQVWAKGLHAIDDEVTSAVVHVVDDVDETTGEVTTRVISEVPGTAVRKPSHRLVVSLDTKAKASAAAAAADMARAALEDDTDTATQDTAPSLTVVPAAAS